MSTDFKNRSNEEIAHEILKPFEDLLAREQEKLKEADQKIREAENKANRVLHPGPP
jgi:hypothetical protein